MKMYPLSLGAGLLVGVVYSVLGVRSPAPPLVALIGLLGILVGEQILPVGQRLLTCCDLPSAWRRSSCMAHMLSMTQEATLSAPGDIHLPLTWIALVSRYLKLSLAAGTGVYTSNDVRSAEGRFKSHHSACAREGCADRGIEAAVGSINFYERVPDDVRACQREQNKALPPKPGVRVDRGERDAGAKLP